MKAPATASLEPGVYTLLIPIGIYARAIFPTGTVVIVKDAIGGDDTFSFTGSGSGIPSSFDIDTSVSDTVVFEGLLAGGDFASKTVSEDLRTHGCAIQLVEGPKSKLQTRASFGLGEAFEQVWQLSQSRQVPLRTAAYMLGVGRVADRAQQALGARRLPGAIDDPQAQPAGLAHPGQVSSQGRHRHFSSVWQQDAGCLFTGIQSALQLIQPGSGCQSALLEAFLAHIDLLVGLKGLEIRGVQTNIPLLEVVLQDDAFLAADLDTGFLHRRRWLPES